MADAQVTSNNNVATTRTITNSLWVTAILYLVNKFTSVNWAFDDEIILLAIPIIVGFFYRLSMIMSQKFPWWGVILFLINRSPGYQNPPPKDPTPENVPGPEGDAGYANRDLLMTVLIVLGIIVLVVLLIKYVNVNVE